MKNIFIQYIITIIFSCLFLFSSYGQENGFIVISNFEIEGNKKTREGTIIRELDFQIGDTIQLPDLASRLGKNQTLLLNTLLFLEVNMNIGNWDTETSQVTIQIKVREAWYLYPIPIFELADRNFNVWWNQYNHSFKRVDYGVRLYYNNLSGRRDILKGVIQLGYTQKYELEYSMPFVNKAKTIGINTNFLFTRNKEIGLTTKENDLQFYRDDNRFLFHRYRFGFGTTYRPELYQTHKIEATYYRRTIKDSVAIFNPDFFLNGKQEQQYFSLAYTYQLDRRDNKAYPLKGYFVEGEIEKEGFGIFKDRNALITRATISYYFQLDKKKKYSVALRAKGQTQLQRQKMPYYNNKALGYEEDFIRGYEYYVVDGMDYAYLKSSIRYEILNKKINWKKAMPFKSFRVMPFRIYLTINSDLGYVNNPYYSTDNPLSNQLLWGGGVGLDFVVYIDKVIRVEYSVNRQGEKGVYLQYQLFF